MSALWIKEMDLLVMRRSKLEIQVDILKVLARHGPLKLTHIMYKANANCSVLKEHLGFLAQHNLVEEQNMPRKGTLYKITGKGKTALTYFRELNSALQITGETPNIPALLY